MYSYLYLYLYMYIRSGRGSSHYTARQTRQMADQKKGSTAFEKDGDGRPDALKRAQMAVLGIDDVDDGFEFVQITIKIWESIVRTGRRLALKRRSWGLFGGHLNPIKKQGLAG